VEAKMKSIAWLLFTSIIVAIIQPFVGWAGSSDAVKDLRILVPASVWVVLCVFGIIRNGRRGLWLLVGAPLALTWPTAFGLFYLACGTRLFPRIECP
jgi:hypothetical protein